MIPYYYILGLSIVKEKKKLEWANGCVCNLGEPNFDSMEFHTTSSRIEIVCGKCLSIICWWPINTEQGVPLSAPRTKKSSAINTMDRNIQVT
jgi:hypothetical protein